MIVALEVCGVLKKLVSNMLGFLSFFKVLEVLEGPGDWWEKNMQI